MAEERNKSDLAKKEEEILKFWKEKDIFNKTLQKTSPKGEFVFYEGPPTANGRPGIHHVEARSFKDAIPRYKTMSGFHVRRKAGWDTHGLPVELEVEKELGISSKPEIEKFGIAKFNELCKKNVWKYVDEWHDFTERMGYFVDMEDAYVTYKPKYIESLWWVLKEISDKGLLYKDYKVVPWCPRCGTALSSHELAQGYADVKDLSVTAKFKVKGEENTYILAWTTTPWTLPGNVALAIGEGIDYVEIEKVEDGNGSIVRFILAKERLKNVFGDGDYQVVREMKGKELVGIEYVPLYSYLRELISGPEKEKLSNAFKVYSADFVTIEDGTGIVHTAVMYGQDDFELGQKAGLPKFHLVDEAGKFKEGMGFLSGKFIKEEGLDVEIIKDLASRSLLFGKHKYEHSYPHCWRCKTPLIYYARDSWYIRTSEVREELKKENEKINWEPDHIKEGRFGEWLANIRDWAISRERYWGTPLPVWLSEDGTVRAVLGSLDELKKKTSRGNKFIIVRHGEAEHNVRNIANSDSSKEYHLTERGKGQVKDLAKLLKDKKVTQIFVSPFLRSKETAEILKSEMNLAANISTDDRLKEFGFGQFDGKDFDEFLKYRDENLKKYSDALPQGESYLDAKKRFAEFLYEVDSQSENETVLVVSHGIAIESIKAAVEGADEKRSLEILAEGRPEPASYFEFDFAFIPHNENYELDLHRPYIDEVAWRDEGRLMKRVTEVMDVWFDSGAMPFAQDHYPFENKEWIEKKGFPADYISEAIDQTRGWFYTLHAIGVLLGRGHAYRNVVCLGHILDKDGLKMSKSKGNTVSPWEMADKYGIDVLRYWMSSITQPGESKNFDEKTVEEVSRKVFNLLGNSLSFYKMYGDPAIRYSSSDNVLDRWILSKLGQLEKDVTDGLESFRLLEPTRAIRDFIADLSQWYVRRSRDRFKDKESKEYREASGTLREVLSRIAVLLAPFTPFFAEEIYQQVKTDNGKESVHLENWPEVSSLSDFDRENLELMESVRLLSSKALEARSRAGIKIRQPLASIKLKELKLRDKNEYLDILKDETNIKEVLFDETSSDELVLDIELTESLIEEGRLRDLIRFLQDMRKMAGLHPSEKINLFFKGNSDGEAFVEKNRDELMRTLGLVGLEKTKEDGQKIDLDALELEFSIKK